MKIDIIEKDGTVTATDPRKTVTFEPDARTEVDPVEAAKLYADYLTLLNSCPSARKYVREEPIAPLGQVYTPTPKPFFTQKPKKITLRILEGEKIS